MVQRRGNVAEATERSVAAHPQASQPKCRWLSPLTGIVRRATDRRAMKLNGFLEFLGRAERDFLACLDLDRSTGGRVAAHPRGALSDLENAQPNDSDPIALLEVLDDQSDQIVENRLCLLLGDFVTLGERRGQMLQGHGRCGWRFCGLCCWHDEGTPCVRDCSNQRITPLAQMQG